jgi:hypothetical protein
MPRVSLRDSLNERNTNTRGRTQILDVSQTVGRDRWALRSLDFPRKSRFFDTSKKVEKSVASANFPT